MLRHFGLMCIAALILGAAPTTRLLAQQAYTLTDLGSGGGRVGLNASGQVAGTAYVSSTTRAFRWTPYASNSPLGTLSLLALPKNTNYSNAGAINNTGQVAGATRKQNGSSIQNEYPTRWDATGTPTTIQVNTRQPSCSGINDAGQIVGSAYFNLNVQQAFLWTGGSVVNIGSIFSNTQSAALGINTHGSIAGDYLTTTGFALGFLWTPFVANGSAGTGTTPMQIVPSNIDDQGQLVGQDPVTYQAALLSATGVLTHLEPTGVFFESYASAENLVGQVVGVGWDSAGNGSAFLWDSTNGMRVLNDSSQFALYDTTGHLLTGWRILTADHINDSGQIAGIASNPAGQNHIFLLTPR